jgi:hypothetical protein
MRRFALTALGLFSALALAAGAQAPAADCPTRLIEKPQVDPRTGQETAAARDARRELEMVVNMIVMYEGCSQGAPDFAARYAPAYREWRAVYRDAIARYERNAHAKRYVQCGLEHERRRASNDTASAKAEKAAVCNHMGAAIEPMTRQRNPG